jgi:hypothetical protein
METLVLSAPPDNPKGWGERVSFGAQEDHSLYPGPGNVVGGFRHDAARNDNGPGVAAEIQGFMDEFGLPVADPLQALVFNSTLHDFLF